MSFLDKFKKAFEKKKQSSALPKTFVSGEKDVDRTQAARKTGARLEPQTVGKESAGLVRPTGASYQNILFKPLVSEKSTDLVAANKYVFEVAPEANKTMIKRAIKEVYGVTPGYVRIVTQRGKQVRFGKTYGRTKFKKKAIVSLKQGDKIQIFEGV